MPLPTLEKTWQHTVGGSVTGGSGAGRGLLRAIVGSAGVLYGFAQNPWVCRGSSDSVAAGLDGVNRWAADGNLVYVTTLGSSSPQSWMVLRNAAGFEVLIRCVSSSTTAYQNASFWISQAGFTGGSTTAPPTAADQAAVLSSSTHMQWLDIAANPTVRRLQALHSTDGRETRIFITGNLTSDRVQTSWVLGEFAEAPAALTKNFYMHVDAAQGNWSWGNDHRAAVMPPAGATFAAFGCEHSTSLGNSSAAACGIAPNQTFANEINSQWPMDRIECWRVATNPFTRFGRLKDIWVAEYASFIQPVGTTFPAGTSRQFCQFGPWVVPWNGTVPVVA